jgi:hypothetical protein
VVRELHKEVTVYVTTFTSCPPPPPAHTMNIVAMKTKYWQTSCTSVIEQQYSYTENDYGEGNTVTYCPAKAFIYTISARPQ